MTRKIFVTTALPYANGPLHIGHIMEYIQADIWVRFQRMQGHELHFVCADDAHGAPIMLKAESEGVTPQQLVARIAAGRRPYLEGFHLSFDHWHSTDSPENTQLSQDVYARLVAAGLVYRKSIEQFYDPVKGMFLADRYLKGECPNCHSPDQYGDACEVCSTVYAPTDLINPYSTLTGAKPVLKASEHLFFRLSDPKCVAFLKEWLDTPGRLQPQVVNKAREWLAGSGEQALGDWDISRDAPYFGIPIPDAPGKYFYVWLDAPIGYLAALQSYFDSGKARANGERRTFAEFLAATDTEQIHFIGKDIIYFHNLFWPAMLKFAGPPYKVPDHVYVHGFLTVSGEKLSKSRGTGISPLRYLELGMNAEWLRYYLAAKLNANVEDLDFNPDDFVARVNSDLVGKYVNIASRAAGFITRHFNGQLAYQGDTEQLAALAAAHAFQVQQAYENREFGKAMREIMALADRFNHDFDARQPWGAGQGPGARRGAAGRVLARPARLQAAVGAAGAGAAAPGRARGAGAVRTRAPLRLERCRHPARTHQPLPAPDDPRRHQDARCTVRGGADRRAAAGAARRERGRAGCCGRTGRRRADLHRRVQTHRPARRAHRRGRDGRRRRQAAEADARSRLRHPHRVRRHQVGL